MKITTQLMKETTDSNVKASINLSLEPQVLTTPSQRCVTYADDGTHQHVERQRSLRGRFATGPSIDSMSVTSLNFCLFCGGEHQLGRQFCKAANLQCFKCGRVGHFVRVCRFELSQKTNNLPLPHDSSKQNWNTEHSSRFDFTKSCPSLRSI